MTPAGSSDDGGVRVGGEVAHGSRVPVIASRQALDFVHALLHDRPLALRRHDERVQVDLEAVGDRVVVDARREPAGADERRRRPGSCDRRSAKFVRGSRDCSPRPPQI